MRLLNTSTLEVQEFLESRVPEYVILSHTWREEEVTLQDLLSGKAPTKKGYAKLTGCCKKAKDDGFAYCWIDTCCIDKTSSAELSEAINSMYQWYKSAEICYAYLEDVRQDLEADGYIFKPFAKSKWFTRGWTLQELIAPPIVEFYDACWADLGTRTSLQPQLTQITGINRNVLTGGDPLRYTVVVKLSWAARRQTSRLEDQAYCLLGILGVSMPLLYGEGRRAFRRLQEEILRVDEDYTLFAWNAVLQTERVLAESPSDFQAFEPVLNSVLAELADASEGFVREHLSKTCFSVFPPPINHSPPHLTSRGCHLDIPLLHDSHEKGSWYGCLACLDHPKPLRVLFCIKLRRVEGSENRFERDWDVLGERSTLALLPVSARHDFTYTSIYVTTSTEFDHVRASLSRVRQSGRSMLRIEVDPRLRSQILSIVSNRDNTQLLPTEGAHAAGVNTLPPAMLSNYYSGWEYDDFLFDFFLSVGLVLIVRVRVDVNISPGLTARIEHVLKEFNSLPVSGWQLRPDCTLDRGTLRAQDPTEGKDHGWSIRLSIRRAGSTPLAPNTKQYVLSLTKIESEHSLTPSSLKIDMEN